LENADTLERRFVERQEPFVNGDNLEEMEEERDVVISLLSEERKPNQNVDGQVVQLEMFNKANVQL